MTPTFQSGSGPTIRGLNATDNFVITIQPNPLVVSSVLMFAWLLVSSGIGLVYRPVRQGRRVAYFTMVSFVFLVIALGIMLSAATRHLSRVAASTVGNALRGVPRIAMDAAAPHSGTPHSGTPHCGTPHCGTPRRAFPTEGDRA